MNCLFSPAFGMNFAYTLHSGYCRFRKWNVRSGGALFGQYKVFLLSTDQDDEALLFFSPAFGSLKNTKDISYEHLGAGGDMAAQTPATARLIPTMSILEHHCGWCGSSIWRGSEHCVDVGPGRSHCRVCSQCSSMPPFREPSISSANGSAQGHHHGNRCS